MKHNINTEVYPWDNDINCDSKFKLPVLENFHIAILCLQKYELSENKNNLSTIELKGTIEFAIEEKKSNRDHRFSLAILKKLYKSISVVNMLDNKNIKINYTNLLAELSKTFYHFKDILINKIKCKEKLLKTLKEDMEKPSFEQIKIEDNKYMLYSSNNQKGKSYKVFIEKEKQYLVQIKNVLKGIFTNIDDKRMDGKL